MNIYIGDGNNIQNRILNQHCKGNVEGSALRQHVATEMGYELARQRRPSGSIKIRIDLPVPSIGEINVSTYIQSGLWQYAICNGAQEAKNFQWYAIEQLMPILNVNQGNWDINNLTRYQQLLLQLQNCHLTSFAQLVTIPQIYSVYLLKIDILPGI